MRIRKHAKISPLLFSSSTDNILQTHVCQLNQSPWDVIIFSPDEPSPYQLDGDDSFTGNGSLGDSIGAERVFVVDTDLEFISNGGNRALILLNLAMSGFSLMDFVSYPRCILPFCSVASLKLSLEEEERKMLKKKYKKRQQFPEYATDDYDGVAKAEGPVLCCKSDGKAWHCLREAKEGHTLCEHHLELLKNYSNVAQSSEKKPDKAVEYKRRPRPKKISSASASNPHEFYYYSGFGPLWGKKRGPERSEASKRMPKVLEPVVRATTPSSPSQNGNVDFDEDEDDDDNNENEVKDVVSDFYSKMQPPKGISDNIFGTSPSFNLASSSLSVVRNIEQPLIKPSIDLDSRFKLNSEEPSGDIGSESEIEPDKLEKQFITAIGATNSRPPLRNYYTRPTPVDMQLEEKNFSNPSSFNGSSIYECNLDGMTDYQVIALLQHMLMAANSARNRNLGESEAVITRYLIAGFTGQLRDSEDDHSLELNNIDGDINSSCSSSNHSSDHEDTCHDCNSKTDYYKAILDMNGLSINVITSEESIILDLLDKIDDPEKKKQVIFKYLHGKQSPPTPNDSRQIPTIGNTFNFSTVMDRLQTIEPKGPTIQDLQGEILSLKRDVKTLSTRISLLELHNIEEIKSEEEEEEIYLNDNNNRLKINPDIANDTKIPSPSKEQEILSIDRVVFQKWYVSIKIVISKDFTFEGIALIDSGADLNCIKEGLVPTKIKLRAKTLPCLCLPLPEAFKIVETDASDIGYGGKMTPPRASSQKSGKGLLPRPNRYNLRKSIGSSSSQPNREAMLGKFENSGYNAHAHCPDIIQIEDEEQDLSPIEVANNYLTNGWAYPQKASGKSRDYYEEILRLTKSAVLTHNFEKPPRHSSRNIELPFQFSKIEILKFITKKQWGIDPTRIRELPPHFSPRHFNYFDYIDAWNHVLLYQNPSHKHSWFIFFSRNFDGNFPNWIANWWLNYGPDFEEWPSTQTSVFPGFYAGNTPSRKVPIPHLNIHQLW
ncbi:hypothetical protein RJ640_022279 [Escallonia rubra]|uniref:WRC domain-containing protein n=1 Tax=Escallonia rubra TaxID=112253 RepID=A0AA88UU82_9ASTE|nr:hypothetical protein RJ640_022279 [Escallonia rubra]